MGRIVWVFCIVFFISGCATTPAWWSNYVVKDQRSATPAQPRPVVDQRLSEDFVSLLLKNYYRLSKAPDFDTVAYLKSAKEQYLLNKNEKTSMEYIVATMLVASPEDLPKVLDLLKEMEIGLLNSKSDESISGLAALLQRLASQQRDTQNELMHQKQQLKEKEIQIAKLQEQINAIKSIEKSIHERRVGGTGESK